MTTSKLPEFEKTRLETWFERDRANVRLIDQGAEPENELLDIWDDDVAQAIEDGFLDGKAFVMGRLMNQDRLHRSAYEWWRSLQGD